MLGTTLDWKQHQNESESNKDYSNDELGRVALNGLIYGLIRYQFVRGWTVFSTQLDYPSVHQLINN